MSVYTYGFERPAAIDYGKNAVISVAAAYGAQQAIDYMFGGGDGNGGGGGRRSPAYMSTAGRRSRRVPGIKRRRTASKMGRRVRRRVVLRRRRYKSRGRSVNTVGRRRVRRTRGVKAGRYSKIGAVRKFEHGGVVSDPNTVFIGHASVATNEVLQTFCYAIARALLLRVGIDFKEWDEPINNPATAWTVFMFFFQAPNDTTENFLSNTWGNGQTAKELAGIIRVFLNTWTSSTHQITKFLMQDSGNVTNAKVDITNSYVDVSLHSRLTIQNRTAADTGTSGDNRNDISNNPLIGRLYQKKGNFFVPNYRFNGDLSYASFCANPNSGVIATNATDSLPDSGRKPPPASFFGASYARGVRVTPGQMMSNVLVTKKVMKMETFLSIMAKYINLYSSAPIVNDFFWLGSCAMFGLEKQLNSRVDEPTISVGYELNQVMSMIVTSNRSGAAPDITIT